MQALTVLVARRIFWQPSSETHTFVHGRRSLFSQWSNGCKGGSLLSSQIAFNVFKGSIPEFVAAEEDALDALDALVVAVVIREF